MIKQEKFKNIVLRLSSKIVGRKSHILCPILLLCCLVSSLTYAQTDSLVAAQDTITNGIFSDSLVIPKDTLPKSLIADSLVSVDNNLETTVVYSADTIIMEVDGETVFLYGNASVEYGDVDLKADFIRFSWVDSEIYAHGVPDSTKLVGEKVKGKPIFTQGAESYNTDTIRYNFKSRKAIIKGIVTQEGEGIIQGEKVKKDPKDNLYLVDAKYSTCDLAEPHFHIAAKKIKLVNKRSIISGPFNLVLAGIPLPIGFPFGFFPVPKKKEIGTSGFIMGSYGEEPNNRGYYFRDFGYYHAFNEYIGAKVLGQIYSKGSFGLGVQSQYTKKYRYSGNVNVQFNVNKPGDELSLQETSRDFNISWSHSPQNKRPDRSFSASVNLVSNGFNQNNRRLDAVDQYTSNTFGSSIQYSKDFGKLIRTSGALRVNQNVSTKVLNAGATYSLAVSQFNPFVPEKKQIGRWYESFRTGLSVNGGYSVTNQNNTRSTSYNDYNIAGVSNEPISAIEERRKQELEQLLLSNNLTDEERILYEEQLAALDSPVIEGIDNILNNGVFNTSYNVPISLPNLKIAKYINLTPSISYKGDVFTKELKYQFVNPGGGEKVVTLSDGRTVTVQGVEDYDSVSYSYDDLQNLRVLVDPNGGGVVVIDTLNKPSFGQSYSFGTSLNTRVYGTYRFNEKGRMQAIRHTVSPSMSLSYTPDTEGQYAYKTVTRQDSTGAITEKYLPRFINSSARTGSASANISFGITNQLEAKMRSKSDTAQNEFEKVSLLDNFSINGSYNLLAKVGLGEFALSNINLSANTSLFKGLIRLNTGGTIDPYQYVKDDLISSNLAGQRVPIFKWKNNTEVDVGDYLSSFNLSMNTTLSPKTFNKGKQGGKETDENEDPAKAAMEKFIKANPMAYVDFSIPWSLTVAYSLNYSKQGLADARVTQALSFRGDFSLTPKWKVTYSTGWDFVYKDVTLTTVGMMRELHCWDMSFNWTPIAGNAARASNYSFDLRVRSSLLKDLKVSRRRQYYDRGGF